MSTLRPATPADLATVQGIVDRAYTPWVEMLGQRPFPLDDDYARHIANGHVELLSDPDPVGVLILIPEDGAMMLDNIALDPAAQGRGLGRRLMEHADARARAMGYDRIRLYTHAGMTANIALYSRAGYVEIDRRTVKDRPRVYMEKPLN